jgi:hypothetical protein
VPFIVKTAKELYENGAEILTLLWHDNAVLMKGGRVYPKLVEGLASLDVTFLTGLQAFELVQQRKRDSQ